MPEIVLTHVRTLDDTEPHTLVVTGTESRQIDVDGRWALPGLWDQHVHMGQWAITSRRLQVTDAQSAAEVAGRCRDAIDPAEPLLGFGFHDALWQDIPTTMLLDEACGEHPVVLVSGDLHCCWANSAALRRYGMPHTDDLLREEPAFELQRRISAIPDETLDRWVDEAARAAAARGVVGIVDMEMTWNQDPWRRRMAAGFDHLRVRASVYPQWLDQAVALGMRSGEVDPDHPLLETGPFKIITDGSMNTRTAFCLDPYPGGDSVGGLSFREDDIRTMMATATSGGLWCAVHAIGDAANRVVLDAFAATGARGRIEHAQLLADADVARFAELGVIASVQPQHLLNDRFVADDVWRGRTAGVYRFRDLLDAGATLHFGSDAPVAPLDPWHQLQAAVERSLPGDEPWHDDQSLSFEDALAASTDGHGLTPATGSQDLCLVDVDPRTLAGLALREAPVALTLCAGRITHSAL